MDEQEPFKFQYDNTLSRNVAKKVIDILFFKFQYDNTLSKERRYRDKYCRTFKFQYDNTLSTYIEIP